MKFGFLALSLTVFLGGCGTILGITPDTKQLASGAQETQRSVTTQVADTSSQATETFMGPKGYPVTRVLSPTVNEAQAEETSAVCFPNSSIASVHADLKTYQWVKENLGYGQAEYTNDSPVWVVTVDGKLSVHTPLSAGEAGTPFSHAQYLVTADAPARPGAFQLNGPPAMPRETPPSPLVPPDAP